jgi:predicted nucleotidyltransferase component of viral defense system
MISKQEIRDLAWEFSLDQNIVEKDYVLGWLLAGIAHHPQLFDQLVFKGGTCLKKCYFETYRFSEDLDYTLKNKALLDEALLLGCFREVATWIENAVGIVIPSDTIRFKTYCNSAGRKAIQGRVGYIGPMQRQRDPVRIRLDLSADELLVTEPVVREIHHPYSDKSEEGFRAYCYGFPEIFAEKIRAMSERARPRDLYDVIHLYRHAYMGDSPELILDILRKKCDYKGIPVPTIAQIQSHDKLSELESEWANMLGHQLPNLPLREPFWNELPNLFSWLYGKESQPTHESLPLPKDIDSIWQPPSMICSWGAPIPLELVRYAGANHLCVEFKNDHDETDVLEPYNLRKNKDGELVLLAVKHGTGETFSYQVAHMKEIIITEIPFIPRYLIELTPLLM